MAKDKTKSGRNPQPAKVNYFFSKGYIDLLNTIKGAWRHNFESAGKQTGLAKGKGIFEKSWRIVAALCIYIFGSVVCVITSAAHIIILAAVLLVIYVCFLIIRLIDSIFIAVNKIHNVCPNPECQAKFLLPVYECPQCKARHTKLVPGKYGILKRKCQCGAKIPTTFLNGRGKLGAYCPECGQSLKGDTASRQYAVPVIGGPSVGKTCYINMAVKQFINDVAPANNWDINFISDSDAVKYNDAVKKLDSGHILDVTTDKNLTAYQLMLRLPKEKVGRRVYIYDIAGESFSSSEEVQGNRAYSYADGFIFIIDPLTLADYEMEVLDKINEKAYGASAQDFNDILDIMLINLGKMFGLKDKDTVKMNVAVVINKMDIPGLEDKIGENPAQQYLVDNPETCKNYEQARDHVCRTFLEEYGAGNFVRTAESKFNQVHYFAVSALGHNNEGQPYRGKNVTEPLMWILSQVDPSIKIAG